MRDREASPGSDPISRSNFDHAGSNIDFPATVDFVAHETVNSLRRACYDTSHVGAGVYVMMSF